MNVNTTGKTWDPYAIITCRDMLRLLSRSVPYTQAVKVFKDDVFSTVINIGDMVKNKDRFVKRRDRIIGPDGNTLRAIELLTGCYVLVQGNTVSAIGSWQGLKQVEEIVIDCMNNVHPIYHIKTMMIKRELAKNPTLANEDWNRFLPKFKKRNIKRKKTVIKKKKNPDVFPPPPPKRKEDYELETGEYFMKKSVRQNKILQDKKNAREEKAKQKQLEKEKQYIPPQETLPYQKKEPTDGQNVDVKELSEKVKGLVKKRKQPPLTDSKDANSFVLKKRKFDK
eukprot:TRINITY_DN1703_c0_g1_i1.p1 TRINITY_DN1703_c0_g1~~TRINITY_DN1703_c0_g1_i1.p1  ORF type:complete len:281 (-),score=48.84 TRINITY_DN1703_c0_g1_i1:32-874(-)